MLKWVLQRKDEADLPKAFDILHEYLAERVDIHLGSNGTYVTADQEYVKKAKRKGHIMLLVDWPLGETRPRN